MAADIIQPLHNRYIQCSAAPAAPSRSGPSNNARRSGPISRRPQRTDRPPAPQTSTQDAPKPRPRRNHQPWKQDWSLPTGLSVTWMGTSSGAPTTNRNVSGTLVRLPNTTYLVDCGEGTHRQLSRTQVDPASIERIFITHLHGDHCFGLAQMLAALDAAKRRGATPPELQNNHVYGPPGTVELLQASLVLTSLQKQLLLPLTITEFVLDESQAHAARPVDASGRILIARQAPVPGPSNPALQQQLSQIGLRDFRQQLLAKVARHQERLRQMGREPSSWELYGGFNYLAQEGLAWPVAAGAARVTAAQLQHRVPCWGYVFEELPSAAEGVPSKQRVRGLIGKAKGSATAGEGGSARPARKVVVLGDTVDSRAIGPAAYGADLLSHEATFAQGMEDRCCVAQHSTAWMAGEFAHAVAAKQLVLTHFSARYDGGGRGGFGRAAGDDALSAEEEEVMQQRAIYRLLKEAQRTFQSSSISAADDFFTFHVPHREG